ncbi:MAG: hypothetical protein ABI136_02600 [Ginsengibacter sp.]
MPDTSNIALPISPEQVFSLVQQLQLKDKIELIHLLEQEQYTNNIPEEHKKLVIQRIKKYNKNPELLIDEDEALKIITAM